MTDTAPACQHLITEVIEVTTYRNQYHCDHCDESWQDAWCCACDDECPSCGHDFSPEQSDELETVELRKGVDVCDACGSTHEW